MVYQMGKGKKRVQMVVFIKDISRKGKNMDLEE
jgi:hypothetical protein